MKNRIIPLIIVLLLCSGCGTTVSNTAVPDTRISPSSTSQLEISPSETSISPSKASPETPSPIALMLASSKMFGLTGVDAVLYDAAVRYEKENTGITATDLNIPSLKILDEYKNADGNTCYIVGFRSYFYIDIGYGLNDLKAPKYNFSGGGYDLSRFTVTKEGICSEVYVSADGEGWAYSIKEICGPKTALAEAVIGNTDLPVTGRDITPADATGMLGTYIKYCFGE